MFLACAGLMLLIVPLSGGRTTFAWNSTVTVVMFAIGGVCIAAFVIYELTVPELPIILFSAMKSPKICILLVSNFLFGTSYYGFFFIVPYYFQLVRTYTPMHSAVLIPMLLTQSAMY